MKLVIIWSNGDKEKLNIDEKHQEDFVKNKAWENFNNWVISIENDSGALNMRHARKVYLED